MSPLRLLFELALLAAFMVSMAMLLAVGTAMQGPF